MKDRPSVKDIIAAARRPKRPAGTRRPGRPRAIDDTKVKRNPARICPTCGSSWTYYRRRKHASLCRSCGRTFNNRPPKPAPDPASLESQLRAELAEKLPAREQSSD